MGDAKLTPVEVSVIEEHNTRLLIGIRGRINSIREIPYLDRPEHVSAELEYWLKCESCLKWSTQIAKQRLGS